MKSFLKCFNISLMLRNELLYTVLRVESTPSAESILFHVCLLPTYSTSVLLASTGCCRTSCLLSCTRHLCHSPRVAIQLLLFFLAGLSWLLVLSLTITHSDELPALFLVALICQHLCTHPFTDQQRPICSGHLHPLHLR